MSKKPETETPNCSKGNDPKKVEEKPKLFGGSYSEHWDNYVVNQTMGTLWRHGSDEEQMALKVIALLDAMDGIAPRDELESMLVAQMFAAHNAAMECYRRAMIDTQHAEARRQNLILASKLSRAFAEHLGTLNRHRGKGQQKVTVEHVHVHEGGQAVVGMVSTKPE